MPINGLYAINENSVNMGNAPVRTGQDGKYPYDTNFDSQNTLAIYMKATETIKEHLKQAESYKSQHEAIKKYDDGHHKDQASDLLVQFSNTIRKTQQIIKEFKKAFILTTHSEYKEIFNLCYARFIYVEDAINLFSVLSAPQYLNNAYTMLDRIIDTFTKFAEIYTAMQLVEHNELNIESNKVKGGINA